MEASEIYKCIAAPLRLRILNLLEVGPLCVCHLQEILKAPQVMMSKQLAIIKQLELIEAKREGTWMVYRLATPIHPLLDANLKHLRSADCAECNQLQQDLAARQLLVTRLTATENDCPDSVAAHSNISSCG